MLPFRRKSLVKKQAINLSHPLSTTTFTTINSFTVLQWCVQDYQLFTSPFSSHWIANTDKTTDISYMHFFHGCSRIEVSYLTANQMGVVNKKFWKLTKSRIDCIKSPKRNLHKLPLIWWGEKLNFAIKYSRAAFEVFLSWIEMCWLQIVGWIDGYRSSFYAKMRFETCSQRRTAL